MIKVAPPTTRFLDLPEGRVAYDDTETAGPLMILVPGIGDLRGQYRFVRQPLARAGFRVVAMDLRGTGESDATFARYDGQMIGDDILALVGALDAGPAIILGNSIAAGAAVYAAAEAPERIARIVLIGGFTRGPNLAWPMRMLLRAVLGGPWRVAAWLGMHGTMFPLGKAPDHDAHRAKMKASLADSGRSAALAQMMLSDHHHSESRLADVRVPTLFVMGTADSDFPDPRAEANEVAQALSGQAVFIEGAGHYPHVEAPEQFLELVLPFVVAEAAA